jgi:hypothetical protein
MQRIVMVISSITVLSLVVFAIVGCVGASDDSSVREVSLRGDICPMATGIAESERQNTLSLNAEIGQIVAKIGNVNLETSISNSLTKRYDQNSQVQMIYALTYSACVSCRVSAANPQQCMAMFKPIIGKYAGILPESSELKDYPSYYKTLIW